MQPTNAIFGSDPPWQQDEIYAGSGATFHGKFATASALNSARRFVSDYHGTMDITVVDNGKITCTWIAEGRITDRSLTQDFNGFIEASSTLCIGKLQRDGSFVFQGAFIGKLPHQPEEAQDDTFTLNGRLSTDTITGDLLIGSVFRNALSQAELSGAILQSSGVAFEAVRNE